MRSWWDDRASSKGQCLGQTLSFVFLRGERTDRARWMRQQISHRGACPRRHSIFGEIPSKKIAVSAKHDNWSRFAGRIGAKTASPPRVDGLWALLNLPAQIRAWYTRLCITAVRLFCCGLSMVDGRAGETLATEKFESSRNNQTCRVTCVGFN